MVRAGYLRVFTVLVAMMAAAVIAMLVAYGSASAEEGVCPDSVPEWSSYGTTPIDDPIGTIPIGDDPISPPPDDPPTVVSTFPKDGATNVDPDTNIKAKFSEKMMKSSVNKRTFNLYEGNLTYADLNIPIDPCDLPATGYWMFKVSYNAKKKLAIHNPGLRLSANTTYTAVVEGAGDFDGQAVKYKAGNEMATDYIWHFTTGRR